MPRSSSERVAATQLNDFSDDFKFEPYLVQYTAYYKPDFVTNIRELKNVLIEVKATANAATRKHLKELSASFRKNGTYFIVAVEIPHLRFRLRKEDLTDSKTKSVVYGKSLCSWLQRNQIKWVEYSTHLPLTEERIYDKLTRPVKL